MVDDRGRERALGGRKQRSVLAILLLHAGEVVSIDRMIDLLLGGVAARERREDGSGVAASRGDVQTARETAQRVIAELRDELGMPFRATTVMRTPRLHSLIVVHTRCNCLGDEVIARLDDDEPAFRDECDRAVLKERTSALLQTRSPGGHAALRRPRPSQ